MSPSTRDAIVSCCAAVLVFASTASAELSRWTLAPDRSGQWDFSDHWTEGIPGPGDNAILDNGGTIVITARTHSPDAFTIATGNGNGTVDQSGGELNVRHHFHIADGPGSSGTYLLSGGSLSAGWAQHGMSGISLFRQTGGSHSVQSYLRVGTSSGGRPGNATYELLGGTLATPELTIGDVVGQGLVRQQGGLASVGRNLRIAGGDDSRGTYEMTGPDAVLNVGGATNNFFDAIYVGDRGIGTFRQSAGAVSAPTLYIGQDKDSAGTYGLEAGRLQTQRSFVGYADRQFSTLYGGTGIFVQDGGEHATGHLHIFPDSHYAFRGGTLSFRGLTVEGGLDLADAPVALHAEHAILNFSRGSLRNAANASFAVTGDSLTIVAPNQDLPASFASYRNDGLVHVAGAPLTIPAGRTVTGHGVIDDLVHARGTLRAVERGTIHLRGGVTVAGGAVVRLEQGELAAIDNRSEITGGTLSGSELNVGDGDDAGMTQSAGTVSFSSVTLGYLGHAGAYRMSGGQFAAGALALGGRSAAEAGTFEQSAGTVQIANLVISLGGGSGAYHLAGGAISTNLINLGFDGPGSFRQTGGTHDVTTFLKIGVLDTGSGAYHLESGKLTIAGLLEVGSTRNDPFGGSLGAGAGAFHVGAAEADVQTMLVGAYATGTGALHLDDPATRLTVRRRFTLGPKATLTAAPGAAVRLEAASFENHSTDPASLADLRDLSLTFTGGTTSAPDRLEIGGADLGPTAAGFTDNFAIGSLVVGEPGRAAILQLTDSFDNRPSSPGSDALYVDHLTLARGSFLDLNGLTLYYRHFSNEGGIVRTGSGGALVAIPEPATLPILILFAGAAHARRTRRTHAPSARSPDHLAS